MFPSGFEQGSSSASQEASGSKRKKVVHQMNDSVFELHKPEGSPSMEIVLFHGLHLGESSDAHLSTWEVEDGSIWPQKWLVEEYPGAHIFTVSYSGGVVKTSYEKFDMYIIVENLISDLRDANIGQTPYCPVILVGHCFGGLVIKQLCLESRNRLSNSREDVRAKAQTFLDNVRGIFYYGTPHHGSPLISPQADERNNPMLKYFRILSTEAERLNFDFDDLRRFYAKWLVGGLGESLPTGSGMFQGGVAAAEGSSRQGDFFNVVAADHISISKPSSKKDRRFYSFTGLLKTIASNSEVEGKKREETMLQEARPQDSVLSSIKTFGDVGWRIIKRVKEFVNNTGDVPEVLADIKAQLPLLIETVDRLRSLGEERLQKIESHNALAEAVTGYGSHLDRLEKLVNKLEPQVMDSRTKKVIKASQSLFYEDEISKILIKLEGYKTLFILHFTHISDKVTKTDESYYMVPSLQVSVYIERIDLLESVKTMVHQMKEQQRRQVVVLLGMGGLGKSQLAMEYCRTARLLKKFRAIFWIDASSIKSAHRSFENIALKIANPSRIFQNIEEKVAFVKDTMDGWDSPWLLVFDNYDAPSPNFNVAAFFPSSPFGTVLVTSRHEDSTRLGEVIPLPKMTEQESLELLFRRSKNKQTDENKEIGKSIVAKLAFLPLAIDQAGAFISAQKLHLTLFLKRFELQKEEILKYTPSLTEYRRVLGNDEKETALNVFTTWELSFQQIRKGEVGERLRSFLTTAAFFSTRDIGEDLFHNANDLEIVPLWMDAFISEGEWDSARYRRALVELSSLSLLNIAIEDTEQCRFDLHPLIGDWLRLRVDLERRQLCTIETCYLLAKLIGSTNIKSCGYAFRLYLLEHLDECLSNKKMYLTPVDEDAGFATIVRDQFVKLLQETSRYREGIALLEEALSIIETAYGKDHASTLKTVHHLGVLYSDQGKFTEADKMYKRALVGREEVLGKNHATTLHIVNNLGVLYTEQGKLTEAEEMIMRALAGYEQALGKDDVMTLRCVHNLGFLYRKQGKFAKAEEMYKHALAGYEKALGKDHALTLRTVNSLGILYDDIGKFTKADEMYKHALAGREEALGKDHALTLSIVNNLGVLYRKQGKLIEAEEMYKRALAGKEKALGRDHASTLHTVNNLGVLYIDQGKFVEAEEMYMRALARKEKALGKDHATTLETVNNLGVLYRIQGKFTKAEEMFKRALAGQEKALGKDHASTLETVNNLGVLYKDQGKVTEAEEMYMRALVGREEALGKDHASTLETINNLGVLYKDQGKVIGAEEMFKRALAGQEKALGKDHASTLQTVNNLGVLYRKQGKFTEAEEMYKHALAGREETLGKDHASTLETVNNLGILYKDQGKVAEAEEMYKHALAGREEALGKDHASTLEIVSNLGILYKEQGKLTEAEEMYKRALAGREEALGKDHASTLEIVSNLRILYKEQGKLTEAEEMYMRALVGQNRLKGKTM